jgi:acyl carrier protein
LPATRIEQTGIRSLEQMELLMEIEAVCAIEISDQAICQNITRADLYSQTLTLENPSL